ncbi:hypothetical protein MSAN_02516700 [Mycena sanguinolenta]|uniref:Uncharacterized protein n=1 Tax=Mycena sanguinolenta TaxID=230812 RepID=A0A8H6TWD6_9AGAR|nr:hypothetical protein MSAN_02516700 [Mycena sanguinolenta]
MHPYLDTPRPWGRPVLCGIRLDDGVGWLVSTCAHIPGFGLNSFFCAALAIPFSSPFCTGRARRASTLFPAHKSSCRAHILRGQTAVTERVAIAFDLVTIAKIVGDKWGAAIQSILVKNSIYHVLPWTGGLCVPQQRHGSERLREQGHPRQQLDRVQRVRSYRGHPHHIISPVVSACLSSAAARSLLRWSTLWFMRQAADTLTVAMQIRRLEVRPSLPSLFSSASISG